MKMLRMEKGISEVVGAMLILLILVVILGILQAYEVPSWNKDIEMQQFDRIHYDFLDIGSDIQNVYLSNIPKTSILSMGVRYPERFLLQNPGPGASGTLTYEPVNVTLTINGISLPNYPSTRIRYSMNGISNQPALVYEYGHVIMDFGGNKSFNESAQSLISGNDINVPVLFAQGQQSVGSMLPESLTINALSTGNYTVIYNTLTVVNVTLPTRYPDLWRNLTKNFPGVVNVTGTGSAGNITINKTVTNLIYPAGIPYGGIYSGMISTQLPPSFQLAAQPGGVEIGGTGAQGFYSNERQSTNRINIPASSEIQKFVIDNITTVAELNNAKSFSFVVTGQNNNFFGVGISIPKGAPPIMADVSIYYNSALFHPPAPTFSVPLSGGINLTSYYNNASINKLNSLVVSEWESPSTANEQSFILSVRFVICSIYDPPC
jgi:hypothetical protein